jgi:hypothetical protein
MTKELVSELRFAAGDYSLFDKHMGNDAADTIERLESELLAATIRIDNDAMEITRLTPLQYRQAPCHKFCEATAFNIEIRALKAERDAAVAELSKVTDELFALSQDDGKIERALDRANAEIKKLRTERDAAIAESLEQARLIGMGGEREAALLGKVDRLEREQVGFALDAARWRALRDMECAMVPPDKLSYYIENYDKLDAHIRNVGTASETAKEEAV